MINVKKLHNEITNAGIEIAGVNADGVVWDINNHEIQKDEAIAAIIAVHDPIEEPVKSITDEIAEIKAEIADLQIIAAAEAAK